MNRHLATLILLLAPAMHAQTPADPSGHWEGTIKAPGLDVPIEVDMAKQTTGAVAGTLTIPVENIRGLPIVVIVEGRSISFHARSDQRVTGELSADGQTIAATVSANGEAIPFDLIRTGEARIDPPARHAALGVRFEGSWHATLQSRMGDLRLVLALANQADGSARGSLAHVDQGLTIPVSVMTTTASHLALEFTAVGVSLNLQLNAAGTELSGTFKQGAVSAPVTFRRAATGGGPSPW